MSKKFASAGLTAGQLNAIVKKLGGHDRALRFLRNELLVFESTRSWREQDGVVYFSVTSDGTTGEEWIEHLEEGGCISNYTQRVLRSSDFRPTKGVTTEIAVLKGTLFADDDRITSKICAEAAKRNFMKPNAEVACLIREKFTDEELKAMDFLWIVVMHEPIKDPVLDHPSLLRVSIKLHDCGLCVYCGAPDYRWDRGIGFAFEFSTLGLDS